MKSLLRLLLKSQNQQNRSGPAQTEKGMTLVELLVGSIMAFLIITPMLGFVVDMLNTDRREQLKTNTEQDVQAALDFIAQDLSQAIYIYDNNPAANGTPNTTPTGIPALIAGNFIPLPNPTQRPILVFWKRQLQQNALPVAPTGPNTPPPSACTQNAGIPTCNDTYVLSLVAYYQVSGGAGIWCQPSGGNNCPTRIERYQIRDGLKDPLTTTPATPYYTNTNVKTGQEISPAYNPRFDISQPTLNVTTVPNLGNPEVLVNYIDHSPGPTVIGNECTTALGNPTQTGTTTAIPETTLKINNNATNSFYACVDTSKNIARVTIRGNSLRRLQANDADFKTTSSAFFPTATVQVQGLGARGK
jgi:type II secretory pathway pseudopilin PulG